MGEDPQLNALREIAVSEEELALMHHDQHKLRLRKNKR